MKFIVSKLIILFAFFTCKMDAYPTNGRSVDQEIAAHYKHKSDSLKLKAAHFLLDNMHYHLSAVSPLLDQYYVGVAKINEQYKYPDCLEHYNMLAEQLGALGEEERMVNDDEVLDAQTIIEHVDAAFNDWQEGLWARHLSFEEFCEYLLPYRVSDEKIESWRKELRKQYLPCTDQMKQCDDQREQAYWATCKINDELRKLRFRNQQILPQLKTEWPISVLRNIRMGTCYDYAKLTVYVMRACGIPVSLDFTPQWPDRAHAHHWNSLRDNKGMTIPFMGGESNPGYPSKQDRRLAKVYRRMFAYQPQSLAAYNATIGERIPPILSSPFIKDVSSEYFKGHDVTIKLNDSHPRDSFVYIAVFNNQEWVPVDFSKIAPNRTAVFHNLGSDIVYTPVYWGRRGSVPASNTFLLKRNGTIEVLQPNMEKLQDITISRKYPLFERIVQFRHMMDYGTFEGANLPDFSDAIVCAETGIVPLTGRGIINISNKRAFRYWRYRAAANRKCYAAELCFYRNGEKLTPKEVLSEGGGLANTKPENVFDNDELTYFESRLAKYGWVGADFGAPVAVDSIEYVPRNDDNDIVAGQEYELCYFLNGHEVSLGTQIARAATITFNNVPSGALYILHNLDKGTEERIFTYNNNQINWY